MVYHFCAFFWPTATPFRTPGTLFQADTVRVWRLKSSHLWVWIWSSTLALLFYQCHRCGDYGCQSGKSLPSILYSALVSCKSVSNRFTRQLLFPGITWYKRVVAIMGWRIQITVQSITQTDFVYGLGNIGLVTYLEVWIGITVACLPTLTPLFSKYLAPVVSRISGHSGKPKAQRQLKEAKHSIGSGEPRGFSMRKFHRLDQDSLLELEEGKNYTTAEAMARSTSTNQEDERWLSDPSAINVRHDIQVCGEQTQ